MQKVFRAAMERLKAGEAATLVTVVQSKGSAPRHAGAVMAVFEDGSAEGTVGGGAVENAARIRAQELLGGAGEIRSYNLSREDAAGLGMICGGDVTLLYNPISKGDAQAVSVFGDILAAAEHHVPRWLAQELREDGSVRMALYGRDKLELGDRLEPEPPRGVLPAFQLGDWPRFVLPVVGAGRALVFGGGHVSRALVPILSSVGFPVFVFEDREEFAEPARFPDAAGVSLCRLDDFLGEVKISQEDFAVIVTRGHQKDYEVLKQVLSTQAAYIGMIGSHAKVEATKERLAADGFEWDDLARVYAPIGIPIGAETPEEIAVSIAAEMIKRRSQLR